MKKILICPLCGRVATSTKTQYGVRNNCCSLWSWGDSPLVDKRTHNARKRAHEYFDIIWKEGFMTRSQAYAWLAKSLKISRNKAHMKKMDYKMAKRVIKLCRNFKTLKHA